MRGPNIFAVLVFAIWLALIWMGADGLWHVASQHVAGYPTFGQIKYYVGIPGAVAIAIAVLAYVFNHVRRSREGLTAVAFISLVAIPAYLISYTGGV